MEAKLQELTQKIYSEGVDKARAEAEEILDQAKGEASSIIENAKKEAEKIVAQAKKEAEQLDAKVKSELKMTAEQALSSLKQEITNILSSSSLSTSIKDANSNKDFIKSMISEIISKWDSSSKSLDLNVILPEKSKSELTDYFKKQAADILGKGVELKFESRMEGGFKIAPKDGSYLLSFTDKDFEQFFYSFLRPKTKEILFPGD